MQQFKIPPYPHFDAPLSQADAKNLVMDCDQVAKHAFFPFLRRNAPKWKFRNKKITSPPKPNPRRITYAGRRDSVIFRRYRDILSERYEDMLEDNGLSECVLAYRPIPSPAGGGKSNIDFAIEAFNAVRQMGICTVFCLDNKVFF